MSSVYDLTERWKQSRFRIRSGWTWGRRYRERGPSPNPNLPLPFQEIAERYSFSKLTQGLDSHSQLLNLSKLHQLEQLYSASTISFSGAPLQVLDVGSQNFVYAPALSLFFSRWKTQRERHVELTGIEIDAYRRYRTLHTRRDLARYYASLRPWVDYQVGDFLEFSFPHPFDVICFFRPHVLREPLLRAGLPLAWLRPQEQFQRALALLKPDGMLIASYQSEAEWEEAQRIFQGLGAKCSEALRWDPVPGALESKPQWLHWVSGT